ncbi:head GIN domain-containing protein [Robertkochia flava]|uniref:head GIN domain-containing protein n=1 Tax=Robertkochia flava TaxID=3447986 RepID=UPI001CCCBE6B|nr:head GIN domain-containing protein [Robertkochia marina]
MKNFMLAGIALLSLNLGHAQWWGGEKVKGNGEMTSKTVSTEPYDKVSVAGSFQVFLTEGSEGMISIDAESNLIPHIEVEAKNGKLKIGTEDGYDLRPSSGKKITIRVPVEELSEVSLAGSGDLVSETVLKGDHVEFNLAGSGDMSIKTDAKKVAANLAGSGDINLEGAAEWLDCNIAGSGDIDAYNLKAMDVEANIAGSGDVMVTCNGQLNANIVGSGDVIYQGEPSKEKSSSLGSGDIKKRTR